MRKAFIQTLVELAEQDERIVLLTGDLGYLVIEPFAEAFPDRYYNVGVAEQNMVGIATGLAEAGLIPFLYSIVTFATLRPYEFIRNGPVLHHLPVRIVGVGGGFEYGAAGPSHHGLEDIGIMRVHPGLVTLAPADYEQTRNALLKTWDMPAPIYYRIGKNDRDTVSGLNGDFELGQLQVVREGKDILLLSMGSVGREVVEAADLLQEVNINAGVAVIASINPPPVDDLCLLLSQHELVVTVEAHYVNGGIGSLVSEVIAEKGLNTRIVRKGVQGSSNGFSGSEQSMLRMNKLDKLSIVETVKHELSLMAH